MRQKTKEPLLRNTHLPLFLTSGVMMGYGIATFLTNRWLGARVMSGKISVGAFQSRLSEVTGIAGLIASILLLVFLVWCAINARGITRTAFIIAVLAAPGPILVAQSANLLFNVIGLPTMSAGSVLAATFAALVFTLPLTVTFILLASSRSHSRSGRWVSLVSVFVVLAALVYPVYVTVLALLIMPGSPGLAPLMTVSGYLLYLRFVLPGLSLLILASISLKQAGKRGAPV